MTTFTLNRMSGGVPIVDAESGTVFGESFVPLYVRDSFKLAGIAALQDDKPGLLFAPSEIVFINKVCALIKQDRDHAEGEAAGEGLEYAPLEEIAVYSGTGVPLGRLSSITVNAATGDPLYFSVEPFPEGEEPCPAPMMPAEEPEEEPAECVCENKQEEPCESAEPVCAEEVCTAEPCKASAEEVCETEQPCETPAEETCKTEQPSETPAEETCKTEQPCEAPAEETCDTEQPCETPAEETCKTEQPSEASAEETCETPAEEPCETPAEEVCEEKQTCKPETEEACGPADDPEEDEADSLPTIEWLLADKAAGKTSTGLSIDLSLREENAKFENALTRELQSADIPAEEPQTTETSAEGPAAEEVLNPQAPAEEPDPLSYEAYYEDTPPEQFLKQLEGMLGPSAYERNEAPAPAVRDDIFEPDVLKAVTDDDLNRMDLDTVNVVAQAFGTEAAKPSETLAEEPVIVSLAAGAEELAKAYEEAEARAKQAAAEEPAPEAPAGEPSGEAAEAPAEQAAEAAEQAAEEASDEEPGSGSVLPEDLLAGVPAINVADALADVTIPEMFEDTGDEETAAEAAAEAPAEEPAESAAEEPAETPAEETKPRSGEPSFRNTAAGDTESFNLNAPEDYYRPNINYNKQLQKRTGSQILGMLIFGGICLLASLL